MSKTFFSSDTHYNHTNIIKYCNRPFSSVDEMNRTLIENWNSKITNNDVVYHLGDFGFGMWRDLHLICKVLNGYKILVRGNHDRSVEGMLNVGFDDVVRQTTLIHNGHTFCLTHFPLREALVHENDIIRGYWCDKPLTRINAILHGHMHLTPDKKIRLRNGVVHYDVGVDANNYMPIEVTEIISELDNYNSLQPD